MKYELEADNAIAGTRLDQALTGLVPGMSRGSIQKAVRNGCCLIDDMPELSPAKKLRAGQKISLELPPEANMLEAADAPLEIIWEDEWLAALNKPAGMTVHPCPSCADTTLVHALLGKYPGLRNMSGERPGIIHRLDKDTSGIMLVALREESRLAMVRAFAQRMVQKEYLALVAGCPPETGACNDPIGRHPTLKIKMAVVAENHGGRSASTTWRRLWTNGSISLVAARIHTGRTHQIRVHLSHSGYPILGDKLYAPQKIQQLAPRQMLHAWQLWLEHPLTKLPLRFLVPPPPDFMDCALNNSRHMERIVITGNQGCGKSSFLKQMENLGLPVISADAIVANLYDKSSHVKDWLRIHSAGEAIEPHCINRKKLLEIISADPDFRRGFENYVHELVADEIEKFWAYHEQMGSSFCVAEIPLFFECQWRERFKPKPVIVGIYCGENIRWQRIAQNRGWDKTKIMTLESWQMPEAKKMSLCDIVVDNSGNPDSLVAESRQILQKLHQGCEMRSKKLASHLQDIWGGKILADVM